MQRLIDSFYSSPPSSSSSSTPSTGDTSCSGTSYSARIRTVSEGGSEVISGLKEFKNKNEPKTVKTKGETQMLDVLKVHNDYQYIYYACVSVGFRVCHFIQ